jgi:hypothetical protein
LKGEDGKKLKEADFPSSGHAFRAERCSKRIPFEAKGEAK